MSKKTKKEKIIAQYHRKLNLIQVPEYKLVSKPDKTVSSAAIAHTDYSYVTSDLRRIAILTAIAICAQLVLWYRLK